jgi:hypothetical protein
MDLDNINQQMFNELFLQKLDDERDKVAATGAAYVRQKLREVSFARKIMNPVYVTKADCQRSLQHDQLVKIVDIEPDSKAMAVNFRGAGDKTYVEGNRYEIAFYKIESDEFQKEEVELLAYEMPITSIIEQNSVKDIQRIEDSGFITRVDAAIAVEEAVKASSKSVATAAGQSYPTAECFTDLFNALEGGNDDATTGYNPLKTDLVLMNYTDFNRIIQMPSSVVGANLASEITIGGYKYPTLFGKKLVVTNKTEYVPAGTIYAFATQEFLGHFFILNDTKFWIEKKKDIVSWTAWEHVGMGIGNTKSVAKNVITYS